MMSIEVQKQKTPRVQIREAISTNHAPSGATVIEVSQDSGVPCQVNKQMLIKMFVTEMTDHLCSCLHVFMGYRALYYRK